VLPIALDCEDPGRATTEFLRDLLRAVKKIRGRNR
jgi:hypothetical protein